MLSTPKKRQRTANVKYLEKSDSNEIHHKYGVVYFPAELKYAVVKAAQISGIPDEVGEISAPLQVDVKGKGKEMFPALLMKLGSERVCYQHEKAARANLLQASSSINDDQEQQVNTVDSSIEDLVYTGSDDDKDEEDGNDLEQSILLDIQAEKEKMLMAEKSGDNGKNNEAAGCSYQEPAAGDLVLVHKEDLKSLIIGINEVVKSVNEGNGLLKELLNKPHPAINQPVPAVPAIQILHNGINIMDISHHAKKPVKYALKVMDVLFTKDELQAGIIERTMKSSRVELDPIRVQKLKDAIAALYGSKYVQAKSTYWTNIRHYINQKCYDSRPPKKNAQS